MSGPPDHAGPPEWTDVPADPGPPAELFEGRSPPYGVRFRQGEDVAEVEARDVDTSRGSGIVEIELDDGRRVTVNASRELEAVR